MVFGVIVGIAAIGIGIGYLAGRRPAGLPPGQVTVSQPADTGAQTSNANADNNQAANSSNQATLPVQSQPEMAVPSNNIAAATNTLANTNWEDKIDDIVGSDDADTNKVKQLFALFPTLPPDGQEEVAQHLSNLVEDDNYGPLGDLLKDSKLPEGVLDELLADLLNRPNSLKLPLLLSVAQEADNAKHDEAKDLLELYLGDDYGTNWSTWQSTMNTWLQQNPD